MAKSDEVEPELSFDHNVVEHLGIKLYANKPTKVLSELVSNSWDADAENAWVEYGYDQGSQVVFVADDGHGMSMDDIRNSYLVIGKPKRRKPTDRTKGDRRPMGRKGIGKLAPFGVARTIEVITASKGRASAFALDLNGIQGESGKYKPPFQYKDIPVADMPDSKDALLGEHIKRIKDRGQGTLIILRNLTINNPIDDTEVAQALGRRLTVILLRDDFTVRINKRKIDSDLALPNFDLRIPSEAGAYQTEQVDGKEVRFWAGFVKAAEWPPEEAGVGVYAHGKLAQDRPFFFSARGKEVFQRYLYAVVEADWLDEQERDLVSTDRTALDWSDPIAKPLHDWGQKKVRQWLEAYTNLRSDRSASEVAQLAKEKRDTSEIPTFSDPENAAVEKLVVEATRDLGRGPEAERTRDQLLRAVSSAWINLPTRKLVKDIWTSIGQGNPASLVALLGKMHEHATPEAMGLALTFAQRAYALSLLHDLVYKKSEVSLQALVEEFPWIIQPRGELLTADKQLKTTIEKAADDAKGNDRIGRSIRGMSAQERADFVFLTDSGRKTIQIVEIKAPGHQLTLDEDRQLMDYIHFTMTFHSTAEVTGLLIGKPGNPRYKSGMTEQIRVVGWEEIFAECRASYIQLLAAMLEVADLSGKDTRFHLVKEFGGDAVWELLKKLADKDERIKELFERFPPNSKIPLLEGVAEADAAK